MITDSELDALRNNIEARLTDFMSDLEHLVNIDCGSYTKAGVDEVGRWVAGRLTQLGAGIEIKPNDELGDIVVGNIHGSGTLSALLVGHMDTVFDAGTVAQRPFTTRDGRAYGPGVDDMKAGLLAGLYALDAIRSLSAGVQGADWLPFRQLTFIANPDEEVGSISSLPIIRAAAETADMAFVLEAARENGNIVSQRKGIADFLMRIDGRAAHAGVEPEKGRSAVIEAAHKTLALTALNGRWPGVTVNVGVVRGGTRPNIVGEWTELEIDLRATTREDMESAEAAIREIAARTTVPDVTATVKRRAMWWPMEKTAATVDLVGQAVELAGRLGFPLSDAATGGASDANTTSDAGAPTLDGLGPVGGNAHASTEYLELDSIVPRVTLLAAMLLSVSREPSLRG